MESRQLQSSPQASTFSALPQTLATSRLEAALTQPGDGSAILGNLEKCRLMFFDPTRGDDEAFSVICREFIQQLGSKPAWAIAEAFKRHISQAQHFPTVGNINTIAISLLAPYGKEIARRRQQKREDEIFAQKAPNRDAAAAERVMRENGFTDDFTAAIKRFPQARGMANVKARAEQVADMGRADISGLSAEQQAKWERMRKEGFL